MKQYEECGYVVGPSAFPSRGAKDAARKMPQLKWPEPRARHKSAMTVRDDGLTEEDETEEQKVEYAPEGKLRHFQTPTQALEVPVQQQLVGKPA